MKLFTWKSIHDLYVIKLTMGLKKCLSIYPSLGHSVKEHHFLTTLLTMELMIPDTNQQPCGRNHEKITSKITFDAIKGVFLNKDWTLSISWRRNSITSTTSKISQILLWIKFQATIDIDSPQCKIIVAYRTLNHRLSIEIGH